MEQGAIQRGVVRAAMEVVYCGDVNRDSPKISNVHGAGKHVCHKVLVLRALNPGDILGVGEESSLLEEGHETRQELEGRYTPGFEWSLSTAKSKCCCSIWKRKGPGSKSISVIAKVAWCKINFLAYSCTEKRSELIPITGFVPPQFCAV